MWQKMLSYGFAAGLIVAIPMNVMLVAMKGQPPLAWGMVFGYVTMLVALSAVFVAIKRYRDRELGGVIGFWRALGLGLGISVVAGLIYVFAWELSLALWLIIKGFDTHRAVSRVAARGTGARHSPSTDVSI